jgi:thioredoxin-like negative regulator of GroEL
MISTVVMGENTDNLLKKAAVAFNKKDFTAAAGLLQQVVQLQPGNSLAAYYYGIALLQTGQTEAARKLFTDLYNGQSVFRYDAAFYMALSYLKEKNKPACREWLQKIPPDANNYARTNELMQKL